MIGDNVYVDKHFEDAYPGDLVPPDLKTLYREAYRETWRYPHFRRALMGLPTFMIFDDHEFWDNWGNHPPTLPGVGHYDREHLAAAMGAYWEYQDSHNPAAAARHPTDKFYYTFEYGDIGFFVLDCRTQRKPNLRTMLGEAQRQALESWLLDNNERYSVKFVVSSVPLTFIALPNWIVNLRHDLVGDQWLGYQGERRKIFKFIHNENIRGVHFLSGDIHLGHAAVFKSEEEAGAPDKQAAPKIYSYTSSPLAQNFWLLDERAPAWFGALAGAFIGVVAWLLARKEAGRRSVRSAHAGRVRRGEMGRDGVPALPFIAIGALLGEFLRRRWERFYDQQPPAGGCSAPDLSDQPLRERPPILGQLIYGFLRRVVRRIYGWFIRQGMGDKVQDEEMNYAPTMLFEHAPELNYGEVQVKRANGGVTVQFVLVDEEGKRIRCEEAPHLVGV